MDAEREQTRATADTDTTELGRAQASLHAKTMVIDRQQVLQGSMNLDPHC